VGDKLGLSENTTRMRVERALDKLHNALAKRGITSTAAALGVALTLHSVTAAPAGIVQRLSAKALAGGVTATAGGGFSGKLVLVALALIIGIGGLIFTNHLRERGTANANSRRATLASREVAESTGTARDTLAEAQNGSSLITDPADSKSATEKQTDSLDEPALALTFVAKDTGKRVPNVAINYRGWEGPHFTKRSLAASATGEALVRLVPGTTQLELGSFMEGFADTTLKWAPERGDTIPTNYTVRLERAALIGGTVVDPQGQPVGGAKVGWNHADDGSEKKGVETLEFGWIEVDTDSRGRWKIDRIAESMLHKIYGGATHPFYQPSENAGFYSSQSARKTLLEELREQTHVFWLKSAGELRGIVVNERDEPISKANVLVGPRGLVGSREGKSGDDGAFEIHGIKTGIVPVTAEADGYAAKTVQLKRVGH
jgi:hypothetical protein